MRSHWRVWLNTDSETKARTVLKWFFERLGREPADTTIEPYSKTGGFVAAFVLEMEAIAWNDQVVEVIALGERVGRGWILTGDVFRAPDGWSNEASVSGVTSIGWSLAKAEA